MMNRPPFQRTVALAAVGVLGLLAGTACASPMSGTFDVDTGGAYGGVGFDPVPWVSPSGSETAYFYPYATADYTEGYSGAGPGYNLAQAQFCDGSINISDGDQVQGDLGLRVGNYSGATRTWAESKVTLDFVSQGSFEVFVPEFTFGSMDNIYFWVADDGATYYANTSKGPGAPDMSASQAMAAGDTYLAAVPEPATMGLLALGGLALIRRRRT